MGQHHRQTGAQPVCVRVTHGIFGLRCLHFNPFHASRNGYLNRICCLTLQLFCNVLCNLSKMPYPQAHAVREFLYRRKSRSRLASHVIDFMLRTASGNNPGLRRGNPFVDGVEAAQIWGSISIPCRPWRNVARRERHNSPPASPPSTLTHAGFRADCRLRGDRLSNLPRWLLVPTGRSPASTPS